MPYLGIFWIEFLKNCCHISNQHIPISLILKFCDKQKNKKRIQSRTKYFTWVFLGLNFKKLFSYLKSARTNLSNCKILRENKNA